MPLPSNHPPSTSIPAWKKHLSWIGLALLLLIALFTQWVVFENVRGKRMLQKWHDEMRVRGEKLTLTELLSHQTPEEKEQREYFFKNVEKLPRFSMENRLSSGESPLWQFVAPGAVIPLLETSITVAALSLPNWNDLEKERASVESTLREIRSCLRPPFFELEVENLPFNDNSRKRSDLQRASRWLAVSSLLYLRQANRSAAVEDLRALFILSDIAQRDPTSVGRFLSENIAKLGMIVIWQALQVDGWTELELMEIQSFCEAKNSWESLALYFEFERARVPNQIQILRSSSEKRANFLANCDFGNTPVFKFIFEVWSILWSYQDEARALNIWQSYVEIARSTVKIRNLSKIQPQLDSLRNPPSLGNLIRFPYTSWTTFSPEPQIQATFRYQAQRTLTETAVALKRYQLRYGRFPPNLEALIPEFLAEPQLDVMDGKPLRYRLQANNSFMLYSVGQNLVDDGGDSQTSSSLQFSFRHGRDMVWPQPATEEEARTFVSGQKQ